MHTLIRTLPSMAERIGIDKSCHKEESNSQAESIMYCVALFWHLDRCSTWPTCRIVKIHLSYYTSITDNLLRTANWFVVEIPKYSWPRSIILREEEEETWVNHCIYNKFRSILICVVFSYSQCNFSMRSFNFELKQYIRLYFKWVNFIIYSNLIFLVFVIKSLI